MLLLTSFDSNEKVLINPNLIKWVERKSRSHSVVHLTCNDTREHLPCGESMFTFSVSETPTEIHEMITGKKCMEALSNDVDENVTNEKLSPIHPSEILYTEYLQPRGMSFEDFAMCASISIDTMRLWANNKMRLNQKFAEKISKMLCQSPEFWLNLQDKYYLSLEQDEKEN